MIKFRCECCDKKIGVPDDFAGKLIKCPKCFSPLRVPESQPELNPDLKTKPITQSQRQSIPKPKSIPIPEPEPMLEPTGSQDYQLETEPAHDNVWSDDMFDAQPAGASAQQQLEIKCPQCKATLAPDTEFCVNCGREIPPPQFVPGSDGSIPQTAIVSAPAGGSFGKDLFALMSPVRSTSDGIVFFILLLMHIFANIDIPIPFIGYGQFLVQGIVYIFLFNVLLETANGNNHLPEFEVPDSTWELIRPVLQMTVSSLYAFLPFIICLVIAISVVGFAFLGALDPSGDGFENSYYEQNEESYDAFEKLPDQDESLIEQYEPLADQDESLLPSDQPYAVQDAPAVGENTPSIEPDESLYEDDEYSDNPFENTAVAATAAIALIFAFILFFVGMFFWPMIVLHIVLGDTFFVHPVKLFMNIIRTFKPYVICCLALFGAAVLTYLSAFKFTVQGLLGDNPSLIIGLIASLVGGLCIEIYTMRVLGLLYRYHEEKLDW